MSKFIQKKNLYCLSINLINNTQAVVNACNIKNISKGYKKFIGLQGLDEVVILQKCNCTEIFIWGDFIPKEIVKIWQTVSSKPKEFNEFDAALYRDNKCIEHLLQTAAGLKSVTIGDGQVLGQVRSALKESKDFGASGSAMDALFRSAKQVALNVKEKTKIGDGNVSVGRQAVELLQNINNNRNQRVLVVGVGAMGSLIVNVLSESGFVFVDVTNRTKIKADELVEKGVAVKSLDFKNYIEQIKNYDVVFFCLATVLSYEEAQRINELNELPIIVDVGNPQSTIVVSSLNKNVEIYSIDTIKKLTSQKYKERISQVKQANEIIRQSVAMVNGAIEKALLNKEVGSNMESSRKTLIKKLHHILPVRNVFENSFRNFLGRNNFSEVHTPYVVSISTDPPRNNSAEELFSVQWYERKLFLRQSNQMYKQMIILSGMDRIFEYGPFWREEASPTARHLSEAYGLDIEMKLASKDGVEKLINLVGSILYFVSKQLVKDNLVSQKKIIEKNIPLVSYNDVFKIVVENFDKQYQYGDDLGYGLEYALANFFKKNNGWAIFAIVYYPNLTKKFYTKDRGSQYTETFDIIYEGWEICSGAVRETDLDRISEKMNESGVASSQFQFYLDYFHDKPVSHGGFCIGIDRVVAKLLSLDTVEDAVLFPRSQTHIIP